MKINMNKITSTSMSNPLVIVVGLLLILILILSVFKSTTPLLNLGFEVNAHLGGLRGSFQIETYENNQGGPSLVAFTIPSCGHCVRMAPEYEKLMKEYKGNVKVVKLDCSEKENRELAQREGVQGYPTIKFYPNGVNGGRPKEYDGERKYTNFVQFLNSVSGTLDKAPDNAAKF